MKATLEPCSDPSKRSVSDQDTSSLAVESRDTSFVTIEVIQYAIVIALSLGLTQSAYHAARRYLFSHFLWSDESLFYVLPVTHVITFTALAALWLFAFGWVCRFRFSISLTTIWFGFFAAFEIMSIVPHLHSGARALLAFAVAVQASRMIHRRTPNLSKMLPRLALALSAFVVALTLGIEGGRIAGERLAMSAVIAPDFDKPAPNVLLIVLDTVRADAVDFGHANSTGFKQAHTPFLTQFASEGVTFDNANSTAPWTLPSHASLFTGKRPHQLTTAWTEPLADRFTTLAEVLLKRGYVTGGFVGNRRYCGSETGISQGFIRYRDYYLSLERFLGSTILSRYVGNIWMRNRSDKLDRKRAPIVTGEFLSWLDNRVIAEKRRPFFAFLNYIDAHHPYILANGNSPHHPRSKEELRMFLQWWSIRKNELAPEQVELARNAYLDCIEYLDQHLAELKKELQNRGLWDNTLVIVTGDHGEQFGEHDLFLHGNSLYTPLIHVPFAMRFPTLVPSGLRVNDTISLVDVPATVMDLVQTAASNQPTTLHGNGTGFPGRSLAEFWRGHVDETRQVYSRIAKPTFFPPCHGRSPVFDGEMESLILDRMKYIHAGEKEELYDLSRDTGEIINLINEPAYAETAVSIKAALRKLQNEE